MTRPSVEEPPGWRVALPVTVVVPTIRPRRRLLDEALRSVKTQTRPPAAVVVEEDVAHLGAAVTRHTGLMRVATPWVAFLDDDDLMMRQHLETLFAHAEAAGADYAYSWFETLPAGCDPFPPGHFLDPWDRDSPRQTTVTTLVRTALAQEVGFLGEDGPTPDGQRAGEDWAFTLGCNRLGKVSHLAERTWWWRHHGYGTPERPGNTSGLGTRW